MLPDNPVPLFIIDKYTYGYFRLSFINTIDGERFAGLNIRGFNTKVFTEILSHFLGHKCSLFSTNKERYLYS